jgi:parvulin-like peptidyl-prolyl isomerase
LLSFSPQQASSEIIDKIVAQVGEKVITLHDIEIYAPSVVKRINAITDSEEHKAAWDDYYKKTLQVMIDSTILDVAAARLGIAINPQQIEQAMAAVQQENTIFRQELREIVDREGVITPEASLYIKNLVIRSEVARQLSARAIVTEQDVRNFLKKDSNIKFGEVQYYVYLLFLPNKTSYNAFTDALDEGTFESAAEITGESVIDMGWVTTAQVIPEMGEVLPSMTIGDVSKPIIDDEGRYIVLKLDNTRTDTTIPDNLRASVTNKLRIDQLDNIYENWLERNKKSILVSRFDK